MIRVHTLQDVVDAGLAPSIEWLQKRLRTGELPGLRMGHGAPGGWKMTDDDIDTLEQYLRNNPRPQHDSTPIGLTAASLKRRGGA